MLLLTHQTTFLHISMSKRIKETLQLHSSVAWWKPKLACMGATGHVRLDTQPTVSRLTWICCQT